MDYHQVMTSPSEPEFDWSVCTWKGSRRKQHQEFHAIPFGRKLEIIEEMNDSIRDLREAQRRSKNPLGEAATAAKR